MQNLAGNDPSPGILDAVSCEKHVSPDTPPCFLWHTGEDLGVPLENSILFATALRECGVPFEMHLYQKGGHGLGLETPFDWACECLRWIKDVMRWSIAAIVNSDAGRADRTRTRIEHDENGRLRRQFWSK